MGVEYLDVPLAKMGLHKQRTLISPIFTATIGQVDSVDSDTVCDKHGAEDVMVAATCALLVGGVRV